jgi:hypothetical protein
LPDLHCVLERLRQPYQLQSTRLLLDFLKDVGGTLLQARQVGLDHSPYEPLIDAGVSMNEHIAQASNLLPGNLPNADFGHLQAGS